MNADGVVGEVGRAGFVSIPVEINNESAIFYFPSEQVNEILKYAFST